MSESLASWLSLREAVDARARSRELTDAIAGSLPADGPLRLVDLATGTGSNIRYLAPGLRGPQQWLAVDRDPNLLAAVPRDLPSVPAGCEIETRCLELGALNDHDHDRERPASRSVPSGSREMAGTENDRVVDEVNELIAGRHLVTASALLDLVSARWIAALAARCRDARAYVLFVLSYDGRSECSPREPEDDLVRGWFNDHQRRNDKGFGRAAGPDAWQIAVDAFRAAEYDVRVERSDWILPPDDSALQRPLIAGWAEAATEIASEQSALIASWRARRLEHVDHGRSHIIVGHQDVAAWPHSVRAGVVGGCSTGL